MLLIKNGNTINTVTLEIEKNDILVENGKIKKIGKIENVENAQIIDATNLFVAPGLIDVHVHFRDPGFTHKEDIHSGSLSAMKGGFTTVICMANTNPIVDNVETLNYILEKAKNEKINVLQTCAITKDFKGQELVDMKTLKESGAIGFTDDGLPIMDSDIILKAMNTAKELDMPLSFHEEDPSLIVNPGVNAGKIAEKLNLEGAKSVAEDVLVARDCMIAINTGCKVNIQHISSKVAVETVKMAKKLGANVYAEATPHHFSLTEEDVLIYGTNAKMNPPLRTNDDKMAIIEGLKDNTIEIIATDHAPHTFDEKNIEFHKAPSGIIGLETALSLGITNLVKKNYLTLPHLIQKMTINPAKLYNLESGVIKEGRNADFVIFDKDEEVVYNNFYSKSSNTPFKGEKLFGKIKYTICNGEVVYKD